MGDSMVQRRIRPVALEASIRPSYFHGLHPRSSLYKQIADAVDQGTLVPKEVKFGILSKRLEAGYCRVGSGLILDGIPQRFKLTAGINKVLSHRVVYFRPSSTLDDVSRKKRQVHAEQIKPLEEYYRKQRKLLHFQVAGGPLAALHLQHRNAVCSTQLSA